MVSTCFGYKWGIVGFMLILWLTGMQEDGCVTFPPQNVVPLGHSSGLWFQWSTAAVSSN